LFCYILGDEHGRIAPPIPRLQPGLENYSIHRLQGELDIRKASRSGREFKDLDDSVLSDQIRYLHYLKALELENRIATMDMEEEKKRI